MAMAAKACAQVAGGGSNTFVSGFQQRSGDGLRVIIGQAGKLSLDSKRQLPHADLVNPALPFRV